MDLFKATIEVEKKWRMMLLKTKHISKAVVGKSFHMSLRSNKMKTKKSPLNFTSWKLSLTVSRAFSVVLRRKKPEC